MMVNRVLTIASILLLLPLTALSVSAESGIGLEERRVDAMDMDNDGFPDMLSTIFAINATQDSHVGVQIIVETDRLVIPFWQNISLNAGEIKFGSISIHAWEDGDYHLRMLIWDHGLEVISHEVDLGTFDLSTALNPPTLGLELQASEEIFTGDECQIVRSFSDEVGEQYDAVGVVLNETAPIDCSSWPAGRYSVSMQYTNGLGFGASTTLDVTIENHPAPDFSILVNGQNQPMGTGCSVVAIAAENQTDIDLVFSWSITNPKNVESTESAVKDLDCGLWDPGVHKVRVTATNPQMQATTFGVNVVRLPPFDPTDPSLGNISDDASWPSSSSGEEYEATPLFLNLEASAAAIGGGGILFGLIFGIFVGLLLTRGNSTSRRLEEVMEAAAPSMNEGEIEDIAEGLPTYTDPQGIIWRQHPDGAMDWWDGAEGIWAKFDS
jgi:hypothetical protein